MEKEKKETKKPELLSLMTFQKKMLELNNKGKEKTMKHRELFPAPKKNEKGEIINDNHGGRRYHAPGTDGKCALCKQIIDTHDQFMELQKNAFGLTGIPFESMMAAIKITVGVIRMLGVEEQKSKEESKVKEK